MRWCLVVCSLACLWSACGRTRLHGSVHDDGMPAERSEDASTGDASLPEPDAGTLDASEPVRPVILSFSGPSAACAGSEIELTYEFANGHGVITPGNVQLDEGEGGIALTLTQTTTYWLDVVDDAGAHPTSAQWTVTALASPDATITAPAAAGRLDTGLVARVPAGPVGSAYTYAWSVPSGNAVITGGAGTRRVTFDVSGAGSEIELAVTVTDAATGCSSVSTHKVQVPCSAPVLLSHVFGVAEYVPDDRANPPFDMNAGGDVWAPRLVQDLNGGSTYDIKVARRVSDDWPQQAGSANTFNYRAAQVYAADVALDDAGNAVLAWLETSDDATYQVKLRFYSATAGFGNVRSVGTSLNQLAPVHVQIERSTGSARLMWIEGPDNAQIPHVRSFSPISDVLGPDIALRATTTNDLTPERMRLDFATNGELDGYAVWYEEDAATGITSLFGVHFTEGAPDVTPGTADYAIETLVQGANTSLDDVMNANSISTTDFHTVAVSASGNAALMWRVYNGLSPAANKGQYYARRYTGGSWGTNELVDARPVLTFSALDWAIDDQGRMLAALGGSSGYAFTHSETSGVWASITALSAVGSVAPLAALDSGTGKGIITYIEQAGGRSALRGAFYDPSLGAIAGVVSLDDPGQGLSRSARIAFEPSGRATLLFNQQANPPPAGASASNKNLQYAVTCE